MGAPPLSATLALFLLFAAASVGSFVASFDLFLGVFVFCFAPSSTAFPAKGAPGFDFDFDFDGVPGFDFDFAGDLFVAVFVDFAGDFALASAGVFLGVFFSSPLQL